MWSRNGKVWTSEILKYVESKILQSCGVDYRVVSTQVCKTALCDLTNFKHKLTLICIFTLQMRFLL